MMIPLKSRNRNLQMAPLAPGRMRHDRHGGLSICSPLARLVDGLSAGAIEPRCRVGDTADGEHVAGGVEIGDGSRRCEGLAVGA